ncbi:MAG: multi-sensor hybrid histidine kinase [Thermoleophilia bacterium]|nr:multi-sensor hybrid histidine kinase [Thermoleophilia bacterium]
MPDRWRGDAVAMRGVDDTDAFARALINILEDADHERERLQLTHSALLNMLDDFVSDKGRVDDTQRATLNILEDFEVATSRLREANVELTQLDVLKSEFVAMASHELRTPLTSITGFATTMLTRWQTLSEGDKYEFVGIIDAQSQRLSRLVEGLLTISRIESGALRTLKTKISVGDSARRAMRELGVTDVQVECDDTLVVLADPDHFQQIIVNLVSNARTHGRAPITISAQAEADRVSIRVTDCGAGVPATFVDRLFVRFAQAGAGTSRASADGSGVGSGLGLSIVQALVEAHGGDVWYEPNTPTGSCFGVHLPGTAAVRGSQVDA